MDEICMKYLDLEIDVNFENKIIYGVVCYIMECIFDMDMVIFDINGLEI